MWCWIVTGLRYCVQALLVALFGKTVSVCADHVMKEAPDFIGAGRYKVHFKMDDTPEGTVEKTARLPWAWLARLWVKVMYRRYAHKPKPRVVYKTRHATVTC